MLPVAILAGGLGTRLLPATEKIPKALVEVRGEPFIAHQLRLLARQGLKRVVLCLGYRAEMVQEYAGDGARFGVQIQYSLDGPLPLGTAGAIRNALALLGEVFFVLYGDSYLLCDYGKVESAFRRSKKAALMTVYRNEGRWDASNVEFENGRIVAYDKRNRTPRMRHIDYGLGGFRRAAFETAPEQGFQDLAKLYQDLLQRDELAGLEVAERFYEAGSAEGLQELSEFLARTAS